MSAEEPWVEVVAHDPRWPVQYQQEAASLRDALGDYALDVEHFGSTAVPGLLAKPIIDILIGTNEDADPSIAVAALESLGYEYLGVDGRRPQRHFWRKRGATAFNVSVVPHLGPLWRSNLSVRDFLRSHPDWVDRYGAAKVRAAAGSATSMLGYQEGKREFVDDLRESALEWAAEQARGYGQQVPRRVVKKVVCYVVRDGRLLVFTHLNHPIEVTGVQVPAGTLQHGETPAQAAIRETREETGVEVAIIRELGSATYDLAPARDEVAHRTFFLLEPIDVPGDRWRAGETDPSTGGTAEQWECWWMPLSQGHVLAAGLGALLGEI